MRLAATTTTTRAIMRWTLAAFYVLGGIGHFLAIDKVVRIVPDFVPYPRAVVIVAGILEIAGAVALPMPRWHRLAGIMLALYAACVFSANIKHAVDGISLLPFAESWWYHAPPAGLAAGHRVVGVVLLGRDRLAGAE